MSLCGNALYKIKIQDDIKNTLHMFFCCWQSSQRGLLKIHERVFLSILRGQINRKSTANTSVLYPVHVTDSGQPVLSYTFLTLFSSLAFNNTAFDCYLFEGLCITFSTIKNEWPRAMVHWFFILYFLTA